jgi:NAD(P) transhydrogenase subunit alpha
MVETMRQGSVIIDLAASTGGNCELTKNKQTVLHNGVTIVGDSNLAASMPSDASKLYGKNVVNFLQLIIDKNGNMDLNWEDDLVKGCCITHNGEVVHERVKSLMVGD